MSPIITHRRVDLWGEDVLEYKPERFLPGGSAEAVLKQHPYAHFPFGEGPHICIGSNFAKLEALLILDKLIGRYVVSSPTVWGHVEAKSVGTIQPKAPLPLVLYPLN